MFLRNQFFGDGVFELPLIKRQSISLQDLSLIGYDKIKPDDDENRESVVHFFLNDYKFEVIWNNPEPRLHTLQQYRAVLSPQFSAYYTMPYSMQLHQIFRSRWCGAYMQSKGLKVIPTIYWGKPQSYWFAFDGIEKKSIVAVSTVGVRREKNFFLQGYEEMLHRINPTAILCYGRCFPEMKGNIKEISYEESNHLDGRKKYWTTLTEKDGIIVGEQTSTPHSISIVKTTGYILGGYGSGGGGSGRQDMGRIYGQAPKNNQRQNDQVRSVASILKLNKKQRQELHRLISHEGMSYQELLEFARQWFNK